MSATKALVLCPTHCPGSSVYIPLMPLPRGELSLLEARVGA